MGNSRLVDEVVRAGKGMCDRPIHLASSGAQGRFPKQYKAPLVRKYNRSSTGAGVAYTVSSISFTASTSQSAPALITATCPLSLAA